MRVDQGGKPINYSDHVWGSSTDCLGVDTYKDNNNDNFKFKDKNNNKDNYKDKDSYMNNDKDKDITKDR